MRQFFIVILTVLLCLGCDPLRNPGYGHVSFSSDTVYFDTVFSSIGSVTREFRAINSGNEPLLIDRIYLGGGSGSPFRLNIDGEPVTGKDGVVIASGDSIFVFVDVLIDPSGAAAPVAVTDSVVFESGGYTMRVILEAWGQDIWLFSNAVTGNALWTEGKPYVVYGSLTVDTGATLTLGAGTRVFFHNKASMTVAGSLVTDGSFDKPVLMASDRTAKEYDDVPGQWKGIEFQDVSTGNLLMHTEIRNAVIAVSVTSADDGIPDLKITGSKLIHNSVSSLVARGADIECVNSLFAHSGFSTVSLSGGGSCDFIFCTLVNRWEYGYRTEPVLYTGKGESKLPAVRIINSVITGTLPGEMEIDASAEEIFGKIYADSSVIKTDTLTNGWWNRNLFISVQTKADPRFLDEANWDFRPDTLSPLVDRAGKSEALIRPYDIRNMPRPTGVRPDIGAYERQPGERRARSGNGQ